MRIVYYLLIFLFSALTTEAQNHSLSGVLHDSKDQSPLIGATILLTNHQDSTKKFYTATDANGRFIFSAPAGNYLLKASYLGYNSLQKQIVLSADLNAGNLNLTHSNNSLKEVKVIGNIPPTQMQGDTMQYNAQAYKTKPDATTEDLIGKMPGITVGNDGTVTAHGETVKKVLVDGKPFFGDDPTAALRNLPAEVVDKIEVFDKLSDQAQFTGFDDGNSQKTINIVTRQDRRNGQFGKLYAGYGTDSRYAAGGNINYFNHDQRISIIGLSNNVNQQNFSTQDLLGVMGGGGGRRGGGGSRGGNGGFRGGGFGGGGINNFLVGQQNGVTATNAIGLNYTDTWGKKINVSGSYFFNNSRNNGDEVLTQNYFQSGDSSQLYNEHDINHSDNYNHRLNLRIEYQIDSFNSIIVTPRLSFQNYTSTNNIAGAYTTPDDSLISQTDNAIHARSSGYNLSNDILFRHSFAKRGRTFSVDLHTEWTKNDGNASLYALNKFYKGVSNLNDSLNQQSPLNSNSRQLSANFIYTEPVGKGGQLHLDYNTSYTNGTSNKSTYNFDNSTNKYSALDTSLSNVYNNKYITNRGGIGYRYRTSGGLFLSAGISYQHAQLSGNQIFPHNADVNKSFNNILLNGMLRFNFSKTKNLRIFYRTSTNAPSISQLQDAIDNSNPLQLSTGNPELQQQTTASLIGRYSAVSTDKSKSFFAFFAVQHANDYIANSTITARRDTMLNGNVLLNKGSQLTLPVNLNGYWSLRTFATWGLPLKFIKSNLNLNAGFNYSRMPGLVNNVMNVSNNYGISVPLVISSNISQNVDFTLSYSPGYNIVKNSIQPALNSNYFTSAGSVKFNWIFWKGIELNNNISFQKYNGLGDAYDKPYLLWNAGLGKKLFKKQNGEIQLSVFDLLKQNQSINRSVTETYIEDSRTNVLRQYFLLTFTYNLRNFGTVPAPSQQHSRMYQYGRQNMYRGFN